MHTKKVLRAAALAAGLAAAVTMLGSCGNDNIVTGSDGLAKFGKEYFGNDLMEMKGSTHNHKETLAWYVAKFSTLTRCEAASYSDKPGGQYEFIRDENAVREADGIWSCKWHDGVAVHIENPDCAEIKVSNPKISTTINVTETPYSIYLLLYEGKTDISFYNKDHRPIS